HVFPDDKPFTVLISDIDDTIVKTFVTDKKKMIGAVLLKNGEQSEPVEGAAACFQAAHVDGYLYVSASPEQLHQRLHTFLTSHGFPAGAILLKHFGKDATFDQKRYKIARIEPLLKAMANMRVILIGDTGESDPESYAELAHTYPERVLRIVIKKTEHSDVTPARFTGMTLVDGPYPIDACATGPAR
ncbi:MAG TPA: App1 family protein, partial [Myxococcota bacterium]